MTAREPAHTLDPADWAIAVAAECVGNVHRFTFAQATNLFAVALRNAEAKGYADGLKRAMKHPALPTPADIERLKAIMVSDPRRSPSEKREWLDRARHAERRAVLSEMQADCQFDHDRAIEERDAWVR